VSASQPAERRQFLSFAVSILQVKEILQYEVITRVPSVPASIRGVINLRGSVVPVVDLSVKLGLPPTPVTPRTCILIVEVALGTDRTVMGVLADAVSEVLELGEGEIEPPPPFGAKVAVDYLTGMGKVGKGFVLLLDLDRALSANEKDLAFRPPAEAVPPRPAEVAAAI